MNRPAVGGTKSARQGRRGTTWYLVRPRRPPYEARHEVRVSQRSALPRKRDIQRFASDCGGLVPQHEILGSRGPQAPGGFRRVREAAFGSKSGLSGIPPINVETRRAKRGSASARKCMRAIRESPLRFYIHKRGRTDCHGPYGPRNDGAARPFPMGLRLPLDLAPGHLVKWCQIPLKAWCLC